MIDNFKKMIADRLNEFNSVETETESNYIAVYIDGLYFACIFFYKDIVSCNSYVYARYEDFTDVDEFIGAMFCSLYY